MGSKRFQKPKFPPAVKAKFIGMIDFLEEYGPFLSGKYTKKIRKNLYELRITRKEQIRIFYTVRQQEIILALLRLDRISHI